MAASAGMPSGQPYPPPEAEQRLHHGPERVHQRAEAYCRPRSDRAFVRWQRARKCSQTAPLAVDGLGLLTSDQAGLVHLRNGAPETRTGSQDHPCPSPQQRRQMGTEEPAQVDVQDHGVRT